MSRYIRAVIAGTEVGVLPPSLNPRSVSHRKFSLKARSWRDANRHPGSPPQPRAQHSAYDGAVILLLILVQTPPPQILI